eukprot:2737781-Amphidinium_carterae.1
MLWGVSKCGHAKDPEVASDAGDYNSISLFGIIAVTFLAAMSMRCWGAIKSQEDGTFTNVALKGGQRKLYRPRARVELPQCQF